MYIAVLGDATLFFVHSNGEGTDPHSVQLWVVDQLLLIIRQRKLPRQSSWMLKATKILLFYSMFQLPSLSTKSLPLGLVYATPDDPFSTSIHQALSQRLASALSDLSNTALSNNPLESSESSSTQKSEELSSGGEPKQRRWNYGTPGVMENGSYFLTALAEYVSELMGAGLTLAEEFTKEVRVHITI